MAALRVHRDVAGPIAAGWPEVQEAKGTVVLHRKCSDGTAPGFHGRVEEFSIRRKSDEARIASFGGEGDGAEFSRIRVQFSQVDSLAGAVVGGCSQIENRFAAVGGGEHGHKEKS